MTTIVFKDGIIAYDSRRTAGDLIISDHVDKKLVVSGISFFISGAPSDFKRFTNQYLNDCRTGDPTSHLSAFVVCGDEICLSGWSSEELWTYPMEEEICYAIGSGREYAFAAMDMGATAKEAVKIAMGRDTGTGGRIRTHKLIDRG